MMRFSLRKLPEIEKTRIVNEFLKELPVPTLIEDFYKLREEKVFKGMKPKKRRNWWRNFKDNPETYPQHKDLIFGIPKIVYYKGTDIKKSYIDPIVIFRQGVLDRWMDIAKSLQEDTISNSDIIDIMEMILDKYAEYHPFLPLFLFTSFYSYIEDATDNQKIQYEKMLNKYQKSIPMGEFNKWMNDFFHADAMFTKMKRSACKRDDKNRDSNLIKDVKNQIAISDSEYINSNEYIKVYRGFVTFSKDVVKGNNHEQLSGQGISYSLSKPIALDFSFKWNRSEKSDGLIKMMHKMQKEGQVNNPAYENIIPEERFGRSTVGTYLVNTKDIIFYENVRQEREVLVNPKNAKLLKYEFFSSEDYEISDDRFNEYNTKLPSLTVHDKTRGVNIPFVESEMLEVFGKDLIGYETISKNFIDYAKGKNWFNLNSEVA